MSNKGRWQKGQSGNPKGKQANVRAMAAMLRDVGELNSHAEMSNQELLARAVWEGLSCGEITLVGDRRYELGLHEWLELMKWVHHHVDGVFHTGVNAETIVVSEEETQAEEPRTILLQYGNNPPFRPTPRTGNRQEVGDSALLLGDGE